MKFLILTFQVAYIILCAENNLMTGGKFFLRLSVTARYAINALSDLYSHSDSNVKPVSVSDISKRQNIPVNYLEQLFAKLRKKGLLKSVRGAQGGYLLARGADEICISDIFDALNESLIFGDCQTEAGCKNAPLCPTFHLWRRVKGSVDEILEDTTLEDLFNEKISLLNKTETDPLRELREEIKNRAVNHEKNNSNLKI